MIERERNLNIVLEKSKKDQQYFANTIFIFLKGLKEALQKLEKSVDPLAYSLIVSKIFHALQNHLDISLFSNSPESYGTFLLTATDQELFSVSNNITLQKYEELEKFKQLGEVFNQSRPKKCALISSLFGTTWTPTFQALKENGWDFLFCIHGDIEETETYAVLTTKEINLGKIEFSSLLSDIIFMAVVTNHPVLINGESYHGAGWDAMDAVAVYLIHSVVINTTQSIRIKNGNNLTYLLYDGLKPIIKNCSKIKESLSEFYLDYLSAIDRIIFNSNDTGFGDFLENAYGLRKPRLHFMRYSVFSRNPKKKLGFGKDNDEFHVVCITTCLSKDMDGARDLAPDLIRSFLNQKIHFHYYACESQTVVSNFIQSVPLQDRKFFHVHSINRNQEELVRDLSQYHIGINPSDYLPFGKVHCYLNDRRYQDGMTKYWESTYPTSALVYAAAGLPVILPTGMYDCRKFLPSVIPFTFSEHYHIRELLSKIDLKEYSQKASELKTSISIECHINQLESFLYEGIK